MNLMTMQNIRVPFLQCTYQFRESHWQNHNIGTNAQLGTIVGGAGNRIESNATGASIVGGQGNNVAAGARYVFIGGGAGNRVTTAGGTLSGGEQNLIESSLATVAGGQNNHVFPNANHAAIGGGSNNIVGCEILERGGL